MADAAMAQFLRPDQKSRRASPGTRFLTLQILLYAFSYRRTIRSVGVAFRDASARGAPAVASQDSARTLKLLKFPTVFSRALHNVVRYPCELKNARAVAFAAHNATS